MKGVILAGGTGSRLTPLTKATNKHLLPIGPQPMIYRSIFQMKKMGIEQVLIVTGCEHMGAVVQSLGSGKEFDLHFTYRVQDEAGGIAQALGLAENFAGRDPICVLLGDNVFENPLNAVLTEFYKNKDHGVVVLANIDLERLKRFGVAVLPGDSCQISKIIEKPSTDYLLELSKNNALFAVTGCYVYPPSVFDTIRELEPSDRGELEITDVNLHFLQNKKLSYYLFTGAWHDAGTPVSYRNANEFAWRYFGAN